MVGAGEGRRLGGQQVIERQDKKMGRGGAAGETSGRMWCGRAVTDNIVVLRLPQGQTRRRERREMWKCTEEPEG